MNSVPNNVAGAVEKAVLLDSEKKLIEGLQKFAQFKRDRRKQRNLKNKANGGPKDGKV